MCEHMLSCIYHLLEVLTVFDNSAALEEAFVYEAVGSQSE